MEPVDPCIPVELLPDGTRAIIKAKDQPQYRPLPSVHTPAGCVITRWTLTDAERAAILRGDDVYLTVWTFNQAVQPVRLDVGPTGNWRDGE